MQGNHGIDAHRSPPGEPASEQCNSKLSRHDVDQNDNASGAKIVVFGEPNSLDWKTPAKGMQATLGGKSVPLVRQMR